MSTDAGGQVRGMIAEDEVPQRRELREQLQQLWPALELVAECEDGLSALEAVEQHRPQVAFLDIRMPGVSGLDVAHAVIAHGGRVVFTTAYDDYAVRAFDAGAIDYLLKPLQRARLEQAIARLRQHRPSPAPGALHKLEEQLRPQGTRLLRWICASIGDGVSMIGIDEVLYFQAQDKYVRVVTAGEEALIRTPLKELLAGLDPEQFWQVHRGVVVRVSAIARMRKDELGRLAIQLRQRPESLPVSAAFAHRFRGM